MSVKKSLWLSVALVMAMSLVFLGCPTDADSSEGTAASYERTALWAAIVTAETSLRSTYKSDMEGGDIASKDKWVTPVQYDAFQQAIDDAREVAYTLSRAAAPTPAEEPALAALTAAQAIFDGEQKKAGNANVVTAANLADVDFTDADEQKVIITGNVTVPTFAIADAAGLVTIAPGAKLTLSGAAEGIGVITGDICVKEGGTFEIVAGTTKKGDGSVSFTGTIIVESGATAIDRKQGGASLFNHANDTGSYEIHEGAIVIVNSQAIGPTYQDVILVGPASGNNKGQVLQLNSGALTITAKSYELEDGTATTLVVDHTVPASSSGSDDGVILSAKSALTVAGGGNLACLSNNDFLKNSANGAKIVLQNENAYLSLLDDTNAITSPVFTITGAPWTMPADPVDGYYRAYITGPAVLVKTAGVWVKQ